MDTTHLSDRERAIYAIKTLPDDATIEDAIDCLELVRDVQTGLREADAGLTFPHEAVMRYFLGERAQDADRVDPTGTR
jgi:hypothetical protein